jgi:hypothetical protein
MEDGIESCRSILIETDKRYVQGLNDNKSRLYIFVPDNIFAKYDSDSIIDDIFSNLIITNTNEKINDLSSKKNGRIIIFEDKSTSSGIYNKL